VNDSTPFVQQDATGEALEARVNVILDGAWSAVRPQLHAALCHFLSAPLTPAAFAAFELYLLSLMRSLGRALMELTLNGLEPKDPWRMPHDARFAGTGYRLLSKKTRNANVMTLFGRICLYRFGYRCWQRDAAERVIFPLEMMLGLIVGTTPALAERIAFYMGEAGATQRRTLEVLRQQYEVSIGTKRLRAITAVVSEAFVQFGYQSQLEELLAALARATASRGSRKPVLAVGRDGCTLRENRHSFFEVAAAATISVYDRAGKRLTTIYLAHHPEALQTTISDMLTQLLTDVLTAWQGPVPVLAYVADSGGNESSYFEEVLRRMLHPRTGQRLHWERVVDYYHVSERIWTMAWALFGQNTKEASGWAHRMLKALKMPSGVSRVLHSAASHMHRRKLGTAKKKLFDKAYKSLQKRTRFLRYSEYKARHIPLGSGVTEAACKTIFTQRLKLSGMRWSYAGAQTILNLRVNILSRTWTQTYTAFLHSLTPTKLAPYGVTGGQTCKNAA
jgi:hypothetical protein